MAEAVLFVAKRTVVVLEWFFPISCHGLEHLNMYQVLYSKAAMVRGVSSK